ncbi:MAG: hypothetical protein ACRD26_18805 [Vicinamibacterales bacterium]
MANVRVYLKYFNTTLDLLLQDVKKLRGKGASRAAEQDLARLHQKLTRVQSLMARECPDPQYRNFDVIERAPARRARKTVRATRKAR